MITTKHKLAAAALAVIALASAVSSFISYMQINRFESRIESEKQNAERTLQLANDLEKKTYVYEEKIRYLEDMLSENRRIAERFDDELEKLSAETDAARRAYGNRSGGTTKR